MNQRKQRVEELFLAALELGSPQERASYLERECAGEPDLQSEVEELLEASSAAEPLFQPHEAATASLRLNAPGLVPEQPGTVIGRYKLLQKIGEGGMGVVYMAEQEEPVRRRVALKIVKLGMDTKQVVARFEAERQALALMDHPNIARVLDGGATETGRPYFVMELVQGVPITEFCDKNQLSTEQRLRLFIPVCQAVQSAHQKGIIHRDLKPTNILVTLNPDGSGFPKVIDFGVAKATSQKLTEKTLFTAHGMMVGTPAYMSPEQAEMSNLDVDTRSDIYSLGALLYELLTGSPPFPEQRLRSAGFNEMQRIILEEQPLKPSTRLSTLQGEQRSIVAQNRGASELTLGRAFPGDLDWIVMKCLEKDRARRYETANGLAHDIKRHLHNEPVTARPPSRLYEFQKTLRRHWVGFAGVAAVLAALGIGVVISTMEAVRARRAEHEQIALRKAEAIQRERGERLFYAGKMTMAQVAWEQNRVSQVRQLLEETADYPDRGFEWYYWQRQTHLELQTLRGHTSDVNGVAFFPDGQRIVTGSLDTTAKIWDANSGQVLLVLTGHLHGVSVAVSADNQQIATGSLDATARLWDATTGRLLHTLVGHTGPVIDVSFSRDDQRMLTCSTDGTVRIWDAVAGTNLLTLEANQGVNNGGARFSPDGRRVVTGGDAPTAKVWDAVNGRKLLELEGHSAGVSCVAWSPDGRWIATGGDGDYTAMVYEAATGKPVAILAGHDAAINWLVFSPDSHRLATVSSDRTARIWDFAAAREILRIKGHADVLNDVGFSPDGRRLITGSRDRTAKVWDVTGDREELTLRGHTLGILSVGFSGNGDRIVTGSDDQTARIWNAADGRSLGELRGHNGPIRCVAFSPDGQRIATGDDQGANVWDAASRQLLFPLQGHTGTVSRLSFSPDGQRILTGGIDRTAKLWEAATGKLLLTLQGHTDGVSGVAFSADGRWVATASADQTARVWDLAATNVLCTLQGHDGVIGSIAFSPDGRRILTGSGDLTARVWDASTGTELLKLKGHRAEVRGVAFSPDGKRLLTGSWDAVKVWDALTGVELLTLKGHLDWVQSVAFSPDGQRILAGSNDATAKLWDAATADQVAAWQGEEKSAKEHEAELARQQQAADKQIHLATAQDPGAIKQWLVLGPLMYDGHSGAKALAQEQIADEIQLRPSAGQLSLAGGNTWAWRPVLLDDYRVDFSRVFRSTASGMVAYLVCYIESEVDRADLSIRVGSSSQSKVCLNGEEVCCHDKPRQFVPDQDTVSVKLKGGPNVLLFKVVNEQGQWRWLASLRFADAAGQPVKGIRVTLTPPVAR